MSIVVFDIDGTLVNVSGLYAWVREERTDYDVYHQLALDAPPNDWVVKELVQHWDSGKTIYLVTVRESRYYNETVSWMAKHSVPYHQLVMRRFGDTRSTVAVKSELVQGLLDQGKKISLAYEDNPDLVKMFRDMEIPVIEVPGWWEE